MIVMEQARESRPVQNPAYRLIRYFLNVFDGFSGL